MRKLNRFAPIQHNGHINNKTLYKLEDFIRYCNVLSDDISGVVQDYFKTHDNPTSYNTKSVIAYSDGKLNDTRVELFNKLKETIENVFIGPIELLDIDFTTTPDYGSICFLSSDGIVEDLYFHKPDYEKIYIREREDEYYDIPDFDNDPLTNSNIPFNLEPKKENEQEKPYLEY